jgi:methionyl aminopeptidase
MFVVGGEEAADDSAKHLLQTTYDCWLSSLNFVKPGNDYKDIGAIIEDYVTPRGLTTVKSFCGHGIGSVFHANPNILHYRNNEPAGKMAAGHTFTIEVMNTTMPHLCLLINTTIPHQFFIIAHDL